MSRSAPYEAVACPLCRTPETTELYRARRFTGTALGEVHIHVAQCVECGFTFDSPRLTEEALRRYYAEDRLASGSIYRSEARDAHYPRLFAERAAFYAPIVARRGPGRLLDVGCGAGGFLRAMAERLPAGWDLVGLEPSRARRASATESGFEVVNGLLGDPLFPDGSFRAISLISVLEHLPDPVAAMTEVARMLEPGGIALLEVPNTLHPELSLTGFFGLEHVCHFTPGSLGHLLERCGLGEMHADRRADGHVLRLAAGSELGAWGIDAPESFGDDRHELAAAVRSYAAEEERFLGALRERVGGALARWKAEGRTVAIYGAGAHTAELGTLFDLHAHASCLVDGDPAKEGTTFLGFEVLAPEAIAERGVGAVLLSSHRFVDEMEATVRRVAGDAVRIQRCYPG